MKMGNHQICESLKNLGIPIEFVKVADPDAFVAGVWLDSEPADPLIGIEESRLLQKLLTKVL